MSGFDLLDNFILDLEALLRRKGSRASFSSATPSTTKPLTAVLAATIAMAQESLREFSISAVANMPTGPAVNIGDNNFELRTRLITMV
jgi:hypothetical protein